mgnify:CR=1 FL=1
MRTVSLPENGDLQIQLLAPGIPQDHFSFLVTANPYTTKSTKRNKTGCLMA